MFLAIKRKPDLFWLFVYTTMSVLGLTMHWVENRFLRWTFLKTSPLSRLCKHSKMKVFENDVCNRCLCLEELLGECRLKQAQTNIHNNGGVWSSVFAQVFTNSPSAKCGSTLHYKQNQRSISHMSLWIWLNTKHFENVIV